MFWLTHNTGSWLASTCQCTITKVGIKKKKKKALEHLNCKLHFKAKTVISTTSKATLAYNHTWIFCQVSIDSARNSTLFKSKMRKNKKYTIASCFLCKPESSNLPPNGIKDPS